jgi:hypothetical protein
MNKPHDAIGKTCIIRCYASGVHIGTVLSVENGSMFSRVTLAKSRRIRYWYGARSLSELANDGLDASKSQVHDPLTIHYIEDAIEIIPVSNKCMDTIRNTTNDSK